MTGKRKSFLRAKKSPEMFGSFGIYYYICTEIECFLIH